MGRQQDLRLVDLTGRERHLRFAMQAMARVAAAFARAARRTLPFLVRRKARLIPQAVTIGETEHPAAPGPTMDVLLEADDSPAWGSVHIGTDALALLLEGALGGGSDDGPPGELPAELTLAQKALVGRIARSLAADFAACIKTEANLVVTVSQLRAVPSGESPEAFGVDGLHVDCIIDGIEGEPTISVAVSAEALQQAAKEDDEEPVHGDPRMLDAVAEVPVEVVAILGKEKMGLRSVLGLKVGQVVRLGRALDDPVTLEVAGVPKLFGVPVVSRGQLSVEIRGRLGEKKDRQS